MLRMTYGEACLKGVVARIEILGVSRCRLVPKTKRSLNMNATANDLSLV